MDEYIRSHRDRFTREAITAELEEAGHPRAEIRAAWERVAEEPRTPEPDRLGGYAWYMYWLGAVLIGLYDLMLLTSGGLTLLGVSWLVAYLALAYVPIRALARARMHGVARSIGLVVAAPLVVLLIGGGICVGTAALLISAAYGT